MAEAHQATSKAEDTAKNTETFEASVEQKPPSPVLIRDMQSPGGLVEEGTEGLSYYSSVLAGRWNLRPPCPEPVYCHTRRWFELGGKLGTGSFGNVYWGSIRRTGSVIAIKSVHEYDYDSDDTESDSDDCLETWERRRIKPLLGEVEVLYALKGKPGIANIIGGPWIEWKKGRAKDPEWTPPRRTREVPAELDVKSWTLNFSTEVCTGDLIKLIGGSGGGPLFEGECQQLFHDLFAALAMLEENGIVHRDIKLENILYLVEEEDETPRFKITDFGLAAFGEGEGEGGTEGYEAPERRQAPYRYFYRSDVFAAGVVMLYTANIPGFRDAWDRCLYEDKGKWFSQITEWAESDMLKHVKKIFALDVEKRATAKEVLDEIDNGLEFGEHTN